jgi:cell division protein FtsN
MNTNTDLTTSTALRRGCVRTLQGFFIFLGMAGAAGAQSAKDSSLYAQAQQMVANGDAANGRKLADSVAGAAQAGTVAFAEGLYWRATLAENARDSEHEYRQIIVDYPLSLRVPDALLRIGQLESARGENAAALQHFQRLVLEHPQSPLHADASYWVAQMYFEANDGTRACTANADALASVKQSNIELKNRIDFQQQRCRGVALATNANPLPTADSMSTASTANTASTPPQPPKPPKPPKPPVALDSAVATASAASQVTSRSPTREEVARALADAEQSTVAKAAASKVASGDADASVPPAKASKTTKSDGAYAVQIAAFGTKPPADLLATKLRGRGYDAYVDGSSAPYRARIGHYETRAEAVAALAKLKVKHIDGFIVQR